MSKVKVFTVRRAYSNGMFSIRVNEKASVVAFKTKALAQRFVAMEKAMWERPQQPLCIDDVVLESLMRRCNMNSLELTLYNEDGEYESIPRNVPDIDNFQFHLENVIKYFDP